MLATIIATVLGFIALLIMQSAGEMRYEHPDQHPSYQRWGWFLGLIFLALAIAVARSL